MREYLRTFWTVFQSVIFVAFCSVGVMYFIGNMNIMAAGHAQNDATKALAGVKQLKDQASDVTAKADAAIDVASKAEQAAEAASHRKFVGEPTSSKLKDLEASVRSLKRDNATMRDEIAQIHQALKK